MPPPAQTLTRPWPPALLLCALVLALTALPPAWQDALALQRDVFSTGQLWRLWTAHAVHWGTAHAVVDGLALLLVSACAGWVWRRAAVLLACGLGAPLLSLGILALEPGLRSYRGASGWVVMLGCLAWVGLWRTRRVGRGWLTLLALGFALKLANEVVQAAAGASPGLGLPPGVRLAWSAHLLGALLGLACGVVLLPQASQASGGVSRPSRGP